MQQTMQERDNYFRKFIHQKDLNKDLNEMIAKMRGTYTKELQNVRDQVSFINVSFFS